MDQNTESQSPMQHLRAAAGWLGLLCSTFAVTLEVFLHRPRTFGRRYLGLQAAAAILLIPAFSAFLPEHDASPLLIFLACYLGMCFLVRVGTITRRAGAAEPHTLYTGTPYIMRFTGRISEKTVKCVIEPILMIPVTMLMMALSLPLGFYFLIATFGLIASTNSSANMDRQRVLSMHDAAIESQRQAEEFRSMRGE